MFVYNILNFKIPVYGHDRYNYYIIRVSLIIFFFSPAELTLNIYNLCDLEGLQQLIVFIGGIFL